MFHEKIREVRAAASGHERVFVVIHAFTGELSSSQLLDAIRDLTYHRDYPIMTINADLAADAEWDLADDTVFDELYRLAAEGFIHVWLGTPPRSTWNRTLSEARPVRASGRWLWGLPDLGKNERSRVLEANILMLNFLAVGEAVAANGGLFC